MNNEANETSETLQFSTKNTSSDPTTVIPTTANPDAPTAAFPQQNINQQNANQQGTSQQNANQQNARVSSAWQEQQQAAQGFTAEKQQYAQYAQYANQNANPYVQYPGQPSQPIQLSQPVQSAQPMQTIVPQMRYKTGPSAATIIWGLILVAVALGAVGGIFLSAGITSPALTIRIWTGLIALIGVAVIASTIGAVVYKNRSAKGSAQANKDDEAQPSDNPAHNAEASLSDFESEK